MHKGIGNSVGKSLRARGIACSLALPIAVLRIESKNTETAANSTILFAYSQKNGVVDTPNPYL